MLENPLDCKEVQLVHPKGNQSWVFIGRTDVEAKTPVLWPLDVKSWLIWKDPDGGKDWRQEEKGKTEDEMVAWHHRLDGDGFGWTQGVGDGQGGLACCGSWGRKELDTTDTTAFQLPERFQGSLPILNSFSSGCPTQISVINPLKTLQYLFREMVPKPVVCWNHLWTF